MKSTLLHCLELAVVIALVYGVTKLFPGLVPNEAVKDVLLVIIGGLAKFARSSDAVPVVDYVNGNS